MKDHLSLQLSVKHSSIFFMALYISKYWIFNNLNIYQILFYNLYDFISILSSLTLPDRKRSLRKTERY